MMSSSARCVLLSSFSSFLATSRLKSCQAVCQLREQGAVLSTCQPGLTQLALRGAAKFSGSCTPSAQVSTGDQLGPDTAVLRKRTLSVSSGSGSGAGSCFGGWTASTGSWSIFFLSLRT